MDGHDRQHCVQSGPAALYSATIQRARPTQSVCSGRAHLARPAVPLAWRVHSVHFGRYLERPEETYAGDPNAFNKVIFPQDVSNCVKCHDPKGSPAWKQNPSRLACLACHDTDKARIHARLNTFDPTPADPYGGDEVETCTICHGADREFSPDKVHNISNPYKPPYPREP